MSHMPPSLAVLALHLDPIIPPSGLILIAYSYIITSVTTLPFGP